MDVGAFTSGLLTGLREGVEAALIVAIICAYLAKTGNARFFPNVFLGAGLAVLLSAVLGLALYATVGSFQEPYEQLFEAATLLVAAGVVDLDAVLDAAPGGQRPGRAPVEGRPGHRRRIGRGARDPGLRRRRSARGSRPPCS